LEPLYFSLLWSLKKLKYLRIAYITPLVYVSIAYIFLSLFGFRDLTNTEIIVQWGTKLGVDSKHQTHVIVVMAFLLLTVGVIKKLGATRGEEIGGRGFLYSN
jgi:hypothetical protein